MPIEPNETGEIREEPIDETALPVTHPSIRSPIKRGIDILGALVDLFITSLLFIAIAIAWNGQEALEVVEERKFDIILMDVSMPLMDGLKATRRIRQGHSPNQATPIIAMTANAFAEDQERCMNAGMDDFMSKPIDIRKLRSIVGRWLMQKTATSQTSVRNTSETTLQVTASPSAEPVFNPAVLDQLAEDTSEELLPELVETFLEETRKRLPVLRQLYAEENWPELGLQAHTLKSGSGAFGALQLQKLAFGMQQAAKTVDKPRLIALMNVLDEIAENSLGAIEGYLAKKNIG